MKFKLKDNPINLNSTTPVEDYLKSIGISKTESFINKPSGNDEESYSLLYNLKEAIEMLNKHIERGSQIYVQIDSDADGYTSSAILVSWLKEITPNINIDLGIHEGKEHGVIPSQIDYTQELVIIPDAGSNQAEELSELSLRADILVLDHHLVDVDASGDKIVIVNNQTSPLFRNKSLSGAGVVYKFIQAYSDYYRLGNVYEKYADLAAIGIIGDAMDSRNLDNNYLIYKGLNNIVNPLVKAMLEARAFSVSSVETPSKIDIAFYIAPIINGLIRFGTMDQKYDFFHALTSYNNTETFTRTWRGAEKHESLYEKAAREAINVKTKQDDSIKKVVPLLQARIEDNNLHKNKIIIVKTSKTDPDEVPKTLTGLVAMRLSAYYNRPVLVLRPVFNKDGITYAGSGRATPADGFSSFKDFLWDSGLVLYSAGHHSAFGAAIQEDNIPKLIEYANQELKDIDFGSSTIEVDAHFEYNFPEVLLRKFAEVNHIYGNGIPEPKFIFDLVVSPSNFNVMGKTKSTFKIVGGGVSFIKFKASEEIDQIENYTGPFKIRVLGRPQINEFRGNKTVQIVVDDMEIIEEEVSLF